MQNEKYLIGLDIGTTTSKGVIVDLKGTIVAEAAIEHNVERVRHGWAEHDADKVWWNDFKCICKTMLKKSGINAKNILSVGFSTLYPVLLPVNEKGEPLRKAILYGIDTRAINEVKILRDHLGNEYSLKTSGNSICATSIAPKMLWLKNNEPEIFEATYKFMNASGYIAFCLTGVFCVDHGSSSLGGLPYRIDATGWDQKTLDECGVKQEQMPQLVWGDTIIGVVSQKAAKETGLAVGTPVTPGTGDHISESLSLGYIRKGYAGISYGTTFGLDVCTDKLLLNPGLSISRSCLKNLYLIGGAMSNGCSLTKWFRDELAVFDCSIDEIENFDPYYQLGLEAETVPAGCNGLIVLPYFSGERIPFFNAKARGVLFGLTLNHTRKHIYRALLESMAFGIKHTLEIIQESGLCINEVISVGGGTKSELWTQIISDVTGLQQYVLKYSQGSSLGSAFLGGLASGIIKEVNTINLWNEIGRTVIPNAANKGIYNKHYKAYRKLYECTKDIMNYIADTDK